MNINDHLTEVLVNPRSYNFWWCILGLEPIHHEHGIRVYSKMRPDIDHVVNMYTKGYFQKISAKPNRGVNEDHASDCEVHPTELDYCLALFGKTLTDILDRSKILYSVNPTPVPTTFSNMELSDGRVMKVIDSGGFSIYHPGDQITETGVYEMIERFCYDFFNLRPVKVRLDQLDNPDFVNRVRETFYEHQEKVRRDEEFVRNGGRFSVNFGIQALTDLVGENEVARFGDQIEYGYRRDGNLYVHLKDGQDRMIGEPNLKLIKGGDQSSSSNLPPMS